MAPPHALFFDSVVEQVDASSTHALVRPGTPKLFRFWLRSRVKPLEPW